MEERRKIVKKIVSVVVLGIILILLVFTLTGCTSSMSFIYNVSTGDQIKVQLDTSNGYKISSKVPFEITKDDTILSQGTFITIDGYEQYANAIGSDSVVKIIDRGEKENIEYIFYSYNNTEFNYIIKVLNSNTGILIGNNQSQQSAEECFKRLTISKE